MNESIICTTQEQTKHRANSNIEGEVKEERLGTRNPTN